MPELSYCPHLIDRATLESCRPALNKLLEGQKGGLRLEKLANSRVYSIRLNRSNRLLLTIQNIQGKPHYIILEYVENHEYASARCLKPKVYKQLFNEDWTKNLETIAPKDFVTCDETLDHCDFTRTEVRFFDYNPIILTNAQNEVLQIPLPGIITGPPGSGKTCTAISMLEQMSQKVDDKASMLYVAPTSDLVHRMRSLWEAHPFETTVSVEFATYEALLNTGESFVSPQQFSDWLKDKCANFHKKSRVKAKKEGQSVFNQLKKQTELVRCEFGLVAALGKEAYLKLGKKQSYFDQETRDSLIELYYAYKKYLKDKNKNDPQFTPLPASQKKYAFTVVDESQIFGAFQLRELFRRSESFLACMDTQQCLETAPVIEVFLQTLYWRMDTKRHKTGVEPVSLNHSWRCPPNVAELATIVLNARQKLQGKQPQNYTKVTSALPEARTGSCIWLNNIDSHCKALKTLCQSPRTAVIIGAKAPENLRAELRRKLNTPMVLKPRQVLGFDFDEVVLYHPLSGREAQEIGKLKAEEAGLADMSWFNALFVSLTRAGKRVIIIQPSKKPCNQDLLNKLKNLCEITDSIGLADKSRSPADIQADWEVLRHKFEQRDEHAIAAEIAKQHLPPKKQETAAKNSETQETGQEKPEKPKFVILNDSQMAKWRKDRQFVEALSVDADISLAQYLQCPASTQVLMKECKRKKNHAITSVFTDQIAKRCMQLNGTDLTVLQTLMFYPHCHDLLYLLLAKWGHFSKNFWNDNLVTQVLKTVPVAEGAASREVLMHKFYKGAQNEDQLALFLNILNRMRPVQKTQVLFMVHCENANHGDSLAFALRNVPANNWNLSYLKDWDAIWKIPTDKCNGTAPLAYYLIRSEVLPNKISRDFVKESMDRFLAVLMKNPLQCFLPFKTDKGEDTCLLDAIADNQFGPLLIKSIFAKLDEVFPDFIKANQQAISQAFKGEDNKTPLSRPLWKMALDSNYRDILDALKYDYPAMFKEGFGSVIQNEMKAVRGILRKNMAMDLDTALFFQRLLGKNIKISEQQAQLYLKWLSILKEQLCPDSNYIPPKPKENDEIRASLKEVQQGLRKNVPMISSKLLSDDQSTLFHDTVEYVSQAFQRFLFEDKRLTMGDVAMLLASLIAFESDSAKSLRVDVYNLAFKDFGTQYFIVLQRCDEKPSNSEAAYIDAIIIDLAEGFVYDWGALPPSHAFREIFQKEDSDKLEVNIITPWAFPQYLLQNVEKGWKDKQNGTLLATYNMLTTLQEKSMPERWRSLCFKQDALQITGKEAFIEGILNTNEPSKKDTEALLDTMAQSDVSKLEKLLLQDYNGKGSLLGHALAGKGSRNVDYKTRLFSSKMLQILLLIWGEKACALPGGKTRPLIRAIVEDTYGRIWFMECIKACKNQSPFVSCLHNIKDWGSLWYAPKSSNGSSYTESLVFRLLTDPDCKLFHNGVDPRFLEQAFAPVLENPDLLLRRHIPSATENNTMHPNGKHCTILHLLATNNDLTEALEYIVDACPELAKKIDFAVLFNDAELEALSRELLHSTFCFLVITQTGLRLLGAVLKHDPQTFEPLRKLLQDDTKREERVRVELLARLYSNTHARILARWIGILPALPEYRLDSTVLKAFVESMRGLNDKLLVCDEERIEKYTTSLGNLSNPYVKIIARKKALPGVVRWISEPKNVYAESLDRLAQSIDNYIDEKEHTEAGLAILIAVSLQMRFYPADPLDAPVSVLKIFQCKLRSKSEEDFYVVLNPDNTFPPNNLAAYLGDNCQVIDVKKRDIMHGRKFIALKKIQKQFADPCTRQSITSRSPLYGADILLQILKSLLLPIPEIDTFKTYEELHARLIMVPHNGHCDVLRKMHKEYQLPPLKGEKIVSGEKEKRLQAQHSIFANASQALPVNVVKGEAMSPKAQQNGSG